MAHIWMRHVAHMSETWLTYECAMSRIWMSQVTHVNESWKTYAQVCHTDNYGLATISRLLKIISLFCRISSLSEGSFAKETCNFKEPTHRSHPIAKPPHESTSRVTQMNESWHTYEWVMAHIGMSHGTHMNGPSHTNQWIVSNIWISHGSHMNESCHT